jgi:Rod binding domain-containing protein
MLTISAFSGVTSAYEAHSATGSLPNVPAELRSATSMIEPFDTYQRSDGSEATRHDSVSTEAVKELKTPELQESDDDKRFREVLHQFVGQTLFGQMLKSMRATQEKNPYFHGGRAEEIFQSQLDMILTEKMTQASSKTLSEPMYQLMKKM